MKKLLMAGLVAMALAACGKKEEAPQAPDSSMQSEQMKDNNMAPMEETQPQSEPSAPIEETPQSNEPQPGSQAEGQDQGTEEPMAMPQQTPDDSSKE